MVLDRQIVIRVCTHLIKYLLERSAENVNILVTHGQKYEIKIQAKILMDDEELRLLRDYLSVQPQEIGYYYLPLIGEYGSEEDLSVVAMLLEDVKINYDRIDQKFELSFRVR